MSDSDDEYDPAAVTVATPTPAQAVVNGASSGPPTHSSAQAPVAVSPANPPTQVRAVGHTTASPVAAELNAGGGLRLSGIQGAVRSLCLNSKATVLCAAGQDGQLCMWDFTVPLAYRRLQPTRVLTPFVNRIAGLQPIVSVHCACDDAYFVACQDGDSPVLISASGKQLETCAMGERGMLDVVKCRAHRAPVTCSAPHPTVAAAFFTGAQDGTARRWDASAVTRGSTYAVKHGSGQITDKVIVECVCSLQSTGSGHVFATGGEDGCVQLWDTRAKYRPGGSVNRWDLYHSDSRTGQPARAPSSSDDFFSLTHVGGLVELEGSEATGAGPLLVARTGRSLQCLDLRIQKGGGVRRAMGSVLDVPNALDVTPLVSGHAPSSFYTCTSRAGFRGHVGGHVLGFTCSGEETSAPQTSSVWRAGSRDEEDVLCVAVDRARPAGSCFAGLDTGDVVVHVGSDHNQPLLDWLATRPGPHAGADRTVGQKSTRADLPDDEEPLF